MVRSSLPGAAIANVNHTMRRPVKVALLISFHNWAGKRQGGFHKFAEALCREGYEVGFLSFPRPWYGALKQSERESAVRLVKQVRGETYRVGSGTLRNFTVPTFSVPGKLRPYLSEALISRLERTSVPSVTRVCRWRFPSVDFVMFESTSSILLYDAFVRAYPTALMVYRPSDPLVADPAIGRALRVAEREVLERADLVLLVDESARAVYRRAFPDLDLNKERFQDLHNGVDLVAFRECAGPSPACFEKRPVALYVGAHPPNWAALTQAAATLPQVTFVVVCPERGARKEVDAFIANSNARFVPGIAPSEVAQYVSNCDVVLVPYDKQRMPRLATLGVTAKMLQAMVARKPIVALHVSRIVAEAGVVVCDTVEQFARSIEAALRAPPPSYSLDLNQYDWREAQDRFLRLVSTRIGASKSLFESAP